MADEKRPLQPDEESSTIFTSPRSSRSIREEEKEDKRRRRSAMAKELAAGDPQTKSITRVMLILLAVVVAVSGLVIYFQTRPDPKGIAPESGHYENPTARAEMSPEGIKSVLREAYYTNDGSLLLVLGLANGLPTPQTVERFDVELYNLNDDLIAAGHQPADWDPASVRVPAEGTAQMTLIIPPEDVVIKADSLYSLTLTTEIVGVPEDPSVLDTTAA
ncbi:MAG: hypothetical protein ACOYJY_02315 [Acutalibacteraceae bacterium]|jgi:hypothetical protein